MKAKNCRRKFCRRIFGVFAVLSFVLILGQCRKDDPDEEPPPHTHWTPVPYRPYAVYTADEEDERITVIDPSEGKVIGYVEVSDHESAVMVAPHNVQVSPNGKQVWVTGVAHDSGGMEQVIIIDPAASHRILKKINAGSAQHLAHVVLDSASENAFVTAYAASQVIQISAKSLTEIKRFDLGAGRNPHGLRYFRGKLYIAGMGSGSLIIVNIADGLVNEVPLGGMPVQTAVVPDGSCIFVSLYDKKEIARYDLVTQVLTKIPLPAGALGPIQIYPSPDSKRLYICDQGYVNNDPASNKVYILDIAASAITGTITAGYATHGVVVSEDGKKVFVTNSLSNTVSVIDAGTQKVIQTIPVGKGPNGISYRFPDGGMP